MLAAIVMKPPLSGLKPTVQCHAVLETMISKASNLDSNPLLLTNSIFLNMNSGMGKKMDQENEMSNHLENQRTLLTWNKKNCRQVPNSLPACE